MHRTTLSDLSKQYLLLRLVLLLSLIFFLIGLVALISRWGATVPIIIFACLFRLVAVWLVQRKYHASWMQASATVAAEQKCGTVSYTARETVSGTLVTDLGLAPDVHIAPHTRLFHVLRGNQSGLPFRLAETAFVRTDGTRKVAGSSPVAGSLITMENALPKDEKWVLLMNDPMNGFCPLKVYERSGWKQVFASSGTAVCFSENGIAGSADAARTMLSRLLNQESAILAASGGNLSLMLPGCFYACKADLSKAPTEEMLKQTVIPALDIMQKLTVAFRKH